MKVSSSPLSILLVLLLFSSAVVAEEASIYRWLDKQGITHFANDVPEAYKDTAKPVEQTVIKPSPEERQRAVERATKLKMEAAQTSSPVLVEDPSTSTTPPKESMAMRKRPAKAPTKETDCKTWKHLFQVSGECFAPYRVVGGGVKEEAFKHCTPVDQPPERCNSSL
jgi:hypothetical protein